MSAEDGGGWDEREAEGLEPPVPREASSRSSRVAHEESAPTRSARAPRAGDEEPVPTRSAAARSAVTSRGRRLVQRLGIPLIILIAVAVLFAFQNLTRITIAFWTIKIVAPLWISLYFWLIVGAIVGYVVGRAVERRPRR